MTNKEKRVALAKDVLAQLRAKKITPDTGRYCRDNGDGTCQVCALGALVVACCDPDEVDCAADAIECLVPTFSRAQVVLIEAAFEQTADAPTANHIEVSMKARRAAAKMFPEVTRRIRNGEYEDDDNYLARDRAASTRRLRAIMRNIIDNDGTFVVAS